MISFTSGSGSGHAARAGHADRFVDRRRHHAEELRIVTDDAERRARHRGHAAEDAEARELRPEVHVDRVAHARVKAGLTPASARSVRRFERRPSSSPKINVSSVVWRIVPGSTITAAT